MKLVVCAKNDLMLSHEVDDVTDSGNYVTKCQTLILRADVGDVLEDMAATCPRCIAPPPLVELPRARRARPAGARPQWRQPRDRMQETKQSLKFAHQALVAAMEWFDRGADLQFLEQFLGQTQMSMRFLKEILIDFNVLQDDSVEDDDSEV